MVQQLLPTHTKIFIDVGLQTVDKNILEKRQTYFYKFNHNIKSEEHKYL